VEPGISVASPFPEIARVDVFINLVPTAFIFSLLPLFVANYLSQRPLVVKINPDDHGPPDQLRILDLAG
jgi:hypothetical protein